MKIASSFVHWFKPKFWRMDCKTLSTDMLRLYVLKNIEKFEFIFQYKARVKGMIKHEKISSSSSDSERSHK